MRARTSVLTVEDRAFNVFLARGSLITTTCIYGVHSTCPDGADRSCFRLRFYVQKLHRDKGQMLTTKNTIFHPQQIQNLNLGSLIFNQKFVAID